MGTSVTVNGTTRVVPETGEDNWGDEVSALLILLAGGLLQKAGGAFTLTAEVDFGADFGLKASYFKSRDTAAVAGAIRLGNAESVSWRNSDNDDDVALGLDGTDRLTFDGVVLATTADKLSAFAATTSAELASVLSDESGTGKVVFNNGPSIANVTLTNVAVAGGSLASLRVGNYLDIDDGSSSAPATPAATSLRLYAKDDKKLYTKDEDGTEREVGSGGFGSLNLVTNPSDNTQWTDVGSMVSITTTDSADLPLGPVVPTAIQLQSSNSAEDEATGYTEFEFTTPAALAAKLGVSFYQRPGVNFVASEWTVSVYQGTTRQTLPTDVSGATYLPNQAGQFRTSFDCQAATTYTLRFARPVNAANDSAALNLADIVVGPGVVVQGAVVEEWKTATPTSNITTNVSLTAKRRRVGDTAEYDVLWTFSGANTQGGVLLTLESGMTIDSTKITSTAGVHAVIGLVAVEDASGAGVYTGVVSPNGTTGVTLYVHQVTGTDIFGNTVSTSAPRPAVTSYQTGDKIRARFSVPIAEWAGSGTVNLAQNDVEYASNSKTDDTATDTTSFAHGPSGNSLPNGAVGTTYTRRVRFSTPIQQGDRVDIELDIGGNGRWLPYSDRLMGYNRQGSTEFGPMLAYVNATDVDVQFSSGGYAPGSTYGTAGSNSWASVSANKWRLKKVSGGQAAGFGEVNPGISAGLVSARGLKGFTDGSSAPAGCVGEYQSQSRARSAASTMTTTTVLNITASPLTLQIGEYEITGQVGITATSATVTDVDIGISSTSATVNVSINNALVPQTTGDYRLFETWTLTTASAEKAWSIPPYRLLVTAANTPIYLIARSTFSAGALQVYGRLNARRVR